MNDIATTEKPSRRDLKETLLAPEMAQVFSSLVPRHVTPERLLRLSVACVTRTPRLLEVPQVQVLGALVQCAALGLEPNSPLQHAHLIPFRNNRTNRYDLQMIIGYRGYIELGRRTGRQKWVHADVVRAGDEFDYAYGNDAHLRHRPGRGGQESQAPTEAYCFVQLDDGFAFVVLPEREILKHREHSFAWRQEKEKSIWVQHADRMWRKTAIRALYSGGEVPLDTELAMAVATDDQRMDWRAMGDLAMKGGKSAIEHLKEGMDTFVAEGEEEPGESEAAEPELRSQVRRASPQTAPGRATEQAASSHWRAQDLATGEEYRVPQTVPGLPPGGGGASPEAAERLKHQGATGTDGKRTRRSVDAIKAEIIQDIRNAQTVEEVEAARDQMQKYTSIMTHAVAGHDINAEAEAMINALRDVTGEIGPDPDRGNLDDRVSMKDVPDDFDRGEPTSASAPTYKLFGLTGTLLGMLTAEEWFVELDDLIEETSPGQREKLLTVNQGIIQKILAERPPLSERLHEVVAKVHPESG